ncbi:MAG: GGDEF domain-containing protein [Pseudomonadales bacterium]|nr:GGDEF domain-containing protein [Pseudomonadales bacterium]
MLMASKHLVSMVGMIKLLFLLLIFIIDLLLPSGIAAGIPYAFVVMFSLKSENYVTTCIIAITSILLTLLGYYLSPPVAGFMEIAIINRALAIFLITGTAIMVMKYQGDQVKIAQLGRLSTTDALTQTKNRRAFEHIMARETDRALRYHRDLSLALIDIDHFKKINDTYGHDAGDELLTAVSKRISSITRSSDEIFRLGGDEFAFLMIETNLTQAQKICEKIRNAFVNQAIGKHSHRLTISIGIAAIQPNDHQATLYKRADKALYHSKNTGRNRVSVLP